MKKFFIVFGVVLITLILASCGEDSSTPTEPTDVTGTEFYPGNVGTTYKYRGQLTDSSGSMDTERNSTYSSKQNVEGTEYIVQTNEITIGSQTITGQPVLFRTTDNGVYVHIDSQVFYDLLDSLDIDASQIEISVDPEITLLSLPFIDQEWTAFGVRINSYNGIPLNNLEVLKLTAHYQGDETMYVQAEGQDMVAKKIRYTANVGIPEMLQSFIPDFPSIEVTANAWYVNNIGIVKTQGSSFIVGAISGGGIDLGDSTAVMSEELVEYNVVH